MSIALDDPGGVGRALSLYKAEAGSAWPDVVLVTANAAGLPSALTLRRSLLSVGGPLAFVLSPNADVCEPSTSWPCGYSVRFSAWTRWDELLRLRQYYLARFFLEGANVMQLDSDVIVIANPFPLLHAQYGGASLISQIDAPIANSGITYARHMNDSRQSDHLIGWALSEWSNRLIWSSKVGSNFRMKTNANDPATFNDILLGLSMGRPRYVMGTIIPETRKRKNSAWTYQDYLWTDRLRKNVTVDSESRRIRLQRQEPPVKISIRNPRTSQPAGISRAHTCISKEKYFQPHRSWWLRPLASDADDPLARTAGKLSPIVLEGLAGASTLIEQHRRQFMITPPMVAPDARALYVAAPVSLFGFFDGNGVERLELSCGQPPPAHTGAPSSNEISLKRTIASPRVRHYGTLRGTGTKDYGDLPPCAPVSLMHLSTYGPKALRPLIVELMQTPWANRMARTRAPASGTIRLDPASWQAPSLLLTNRTHFELAMVRMFDLAVRTGRQLVLPELSPHTSWVPQPTSFATIGCSLSSDAIIKSRRTDLFRQADSLRSSVPDSAIERPPHSARRVWLPRLFHDECRVVDEVAKRIALETSARSRDHASMIATMSLPLAPLSDSQETTWIIGSDVEAGIALGDPRGALDANIEVGLTLVEANRLSTIQHSHPAHDLPSWRVSFRDWSIADSEMWRKQYLHRVESGATTLPKCLCRMAGEAALVRARRLHMLGQMGVHSNSSLTREVVAKHAERERRRCVMKQETEPHRRHH